MREVVVREHEVERSAMNERLVREWNDLDMRRSRGKEGARWIWRDVPRVWFCWLGGYDLVRRELMGIEYRILNILRVAMARYVHYKELYIYGMNLYMICGK